MVFADPKGVIDAFINNSKSISIIQDVGTDDPQIVLIGVPEFARELGKFLVDLADSLEEVQEQS